MSVSASTIKLCLACLSLGLFSACSGLQELQDRIGISASTSADQDLSVQRTPQGLMMVLEAVYFEVNSAKLLPSGKLRAALISRVLARHAGKQVLVEGHTDSTGDDAYNQRLSQARAQAVAGELVSNGTPLSRLVVTGYGETRPIADNDTAEGRQQNRRVQILVLDENP